MDATIFSFSLILLKISVTGFLLPKEKWRLEAFDFQKDFNSGSKYIEKNVQEQNGAIVVTKDKNINDIIFNEFHKEDRFFAASYNLKSEIMDKMFNNSVNFEETLRIDRKELNSKLPINVSEENIFGRSITEDSTLPIFLYEPENAFIVKNRPASLKCKVAHALQINFKCSGSIQPLPSTHDKHVDPHTGVHVEEVTTMVKRDLLDEFFGKGPFKCECYAWSSRGLVKSQPAVISIAYIRKQFLTSPTSLKVEFESRAELLCEPPSGYPEPKITWIKNNIVMLNDSDAVIMSNGSLLFKKVSLKNMANYTCIAENIAGKRTSDSAVMIVYVNGGWSSWGSWKDCHCLGQLSLGKKRIRSCNNPVPMNGGAHCSGPQMQKSIDCLPCQAWTWSQWSNWSSCTSDCVQTRRRRCVLNTSHKDQENKNEIVSETTAITNSYSSNTIEFEKYLCIGKDVEILECRGGNCKIKELYFDWYTLVSFISIVTICFIFGSIFVCLTRRGISSAIHYNLKIDSNYVKNAGEKEFNIHTENVNNSYEYANVQQIPSSCEDLSERKSSEHHYDVPNLIRNYSNPIDDLNTSSFLNNSDIITKNGSIFSFNEGNLCGYPTITCKYINDTCGILKLYNGDILLYIPEFAVNHKLKYLISLQVLNDDTTRISIPSSETLIICSSIIHCTPQNTFFDKPVILKLPHCLVDITQWTVSVCYVDVDQGESNTTWHKICSVGDVTANSSVVINITSAHIFIITERIGRFFAIAEKKNSLNKPASIKMKLYAFSQISPSNIICNIRIYMVKDLPNSKDLCVTIETPLGGTFIGESQKFDFFIDYSDLSIRIYDTDNIFEHVIPFQHFLNNNSVLNCEFNFHMRKEFCSGFSFKVEFLQKSEIIRGKEYQTFSISSEYKSEDFISSENEKCMYLNTQGSFTSEQNYFESWQIIRIIKKQLCTALDPSRSDERDWRILAKRLKLDQFIPFFATKSSPTEQMLNLWECQSFGSTRCIIDLLRILNEIEREDVVKIISKNSVPIWI